MPVYNGSMPSGIPGNISRPGIGIIESVILGEDILYGDAVALVNGKAVKATSAAVTVGVLVRPYPSQSAVDDFGRAKALKGSIQGMMRQGYMTILIAAGDAAASIVNGAPVKLVNAAAAGFVIGDFAATQGAAIARTTFTGPPDANRNVEIAFNI